MLLNEGNIQYLFNFSNERSFFHGVHHDFRFTMLGAQKGFQADGFWSVFRFNPRVAVTPDDLPEFLGSTSNLIFINRHTLAKFSPDSLSVMEFQQQRDFGVAEKIYDAQQSNVWDIQFAREFDMANDAHLFNQDKRGLPLYEGKMIHQFDTEYLTPRYWIDEDLGTQKLASSPAATWFRQYRLAFRAISNATNERTCISAILPPNNFTGHSLWVGKTAENANLLFFISLFNSYCIDWIARFKVNTNVTLFVVQQLPIPRLNPGNPYFEAIVQRAAQLTCTRPEFAALWEEVMGSPWEPPSASNPFSQEAEGSQADDLFPSPSGRGARGEGYTGQIPKPLIEAARNLRQRQTSAETLLWELLRGEQLNGLKFRRQHPIRGTSYIADFYCHEASLVVELDGPIHDQQRSVDALRQADIEALGLRVLRFTNQQVIEQTEMVLQSIMDTIGPHPISLSQKARDLKRESSGSPLPLGEGSRLYSSDGVRAFPATDPAARQRLRDEIDAIVAHLYGLSRDDFDHILGTFPLVFPDNEAGRAKRAALLTEFDRWAGQLGG
jgi:very-short-patch-repair endonuclease